MEQPSEELPDSSTNLNQTAPKLPLQFKTKKSTSRSSGPSHNKSVLLSRSPLGVIGTNSSYMIESPKNSEDGGSRTTSPNAPRSPSKKRFKSTFGSLTGYPNSALTIAGQSSDYHSSRPRVTFSPAPI